MLLQAGSFQGEQKVYFHGNTSMWTYCGKFNRLNDLARIGKGNRGVLESPPAPANRKCVTPLADTARLAHTASQETSAPFSGGSHERLSKDLDRRVGKSMTYSPPALPAGISVVFRAEIVKINALS
jgi:hypothetical protein